MMGCGRADGVLTWIFRLHVNMLTGMGMRAGVIQICAHDLVVQILLGQDQYHCTHSCAYIHTYMYPYENR